MEREIQPPLDVYLGQSLGGVTGLIVKQTAFVDEEYVERKLLQVLEKPEIKRILEKNPYLPIVVTSADRFKFEPSAIYHAASPKLFVMAEVSEPAANMWHYKAINHVVDLNTCHEEQRYDYPFNMFSFIIGRTVDNLPMIPWNLLLYTRGDCVRRIIHMGLSDKAIMNFVLNNPGWQVLFRLKARSVNFAAPQST